MDNTWPVGTAVENWNKSPDGRLKLALQEDDCLSVVLVTSRLVEGAPQMWGKTEYDKNGYRAYVTLSPVTPLLERAQVVCHELGHVLGRPHVIDTDSCMNPSLGIPVPSAKDLQEAGKNYWMYQ